MRNLAVARHYVYLISDKREVVVYTNPQRFRALTAQMLKIVLLVKGGLAQRSAMSQLFVVVVLTYRLAFPSHYLFKVYQPN